MQFTKVTEELAANGVGNHVHTVPKIACNVEQQLLDTQKRTQTLLMICWRCNKLAAAQLTVCFPFVWIGYS